MSSAARSLTAAGEAAVGLAIPAARRQSSSLRHVGHRNRLPPGSPWVMAQTWRRLLFAHWRVPAEALRAVVPPQLPLDVIDGDAWLGITPFEVRAFRLRSSPPPPVVSSFGELNVRTYVTVDGRPGIHFLSLDAASRLAVAAARRGYRLPYFRAAMATGGDGRTGVAFESRRVSADGPPAELSVRYRAAGDGRPAQPDTVEHSLTERYCLYTLDSDGRVLTGDIHHRPWRLQPAQARLGRNTMTAGFGIPLEGEPLLHYADRQDVVFWPLRPVGETPGRY